MSHQVSDVVDAVFDHGGPAEQRRRPSEEEENADGETEEFDTEVFKSD